MSEFIEVFEDAGIEVREALALTTQRVDRENNTINDVKLVGMVSPSHKRRYPIRVLEEAIPLYEGKPIYFKHLKKPGEERDPRDAWGKVVNVRVVEGDGLRGDVQYNPKHADTEQMLWVAESAPELAGMSHHAFVAGDYDSDGWLNVTKVAVVKSVDVVANGGTVTSLFESELTEGELEDRLAKERPMAEMERVTHTAHSLIWDQMFGVGPLEDRRSNIVQILEEWIKQLEGLDTTTVQENDMELKDLTLEQLRTGRPDLVTKLVTESEAVKTLTEENNTLKAQARKADRLVAITEAELGELDTEGFRAQCVHESVSDELFESMLEDRKGLIGKATAGGEKPTSKLREVSESEGTLTKKDVLGAFGK